MQNPYGTPYDLGDIPQTEEELFRSFIDSVNNAISNKVLYDFNDKEELGKFIDNFLEEIVFCMNYDAEFGVEVLSIPDEFRFKRNGDSILYSVKSTDSWFEVSQANRKTAIKIHKNPDNGCACIYKFCPQGAPYPLYAINFEFSTDKEEKVLALYKKLAIDYISLKGIGSLPDFLKVVIANYKYYKKSSATQNE